MTIKSKDNTDIRIFKIKFVVFPKPIRARIEMECSAGESIV